MPPALVLIVRHGEKLGDPNNDGDGCPNLSVRGSARAAALPSLFQPANTALSCQWQARGPNLQGTYASTQESGTPTYPIPAFLFATAPSNNSNRPLETITPLSVALSLEINNKHKDGDYAKVAEDLLTNSKYEGQNVLICWHHGQIPDLAAALKAQNIPPWPGTVFDRVWQIPFTNGTAGPVQNAPQSLLYGDSST
jgi:hypothetical protein